MTRHHAQQDTAQAGDWDSDIEKIRNGTEESPGGDATVCS